MQIRPENASIREAYGLMQKAYTFEPLPPREGDMEWEEFSEFSIPTNWGW